MKVAIKTAAIVTTLVSNAGRQRRLRSRPPPCPTAPTRSFAASTQGRGIVVLRYTGATNVNAGVLGLASDQDYSVIGRSIPCDGQPSPANRIFRLNVRTGASGDLFLSRAVPINGSFGLSGSGHLMAVRRCRAR